MSTSNFKGLVEEYLDTVTSRIILECEYGSNFGEKLLNHKIRKHVGTKNWRSVAKYLASYTDFIGANVHFKDIINPDLYSVIKGNVRKCECGGMIAFSYFSESENKSKCFDTTVRFEELLNIDVVDHERKFIARSIRHTVIVKSSSVPKIEDVAIAAGYHPSGYGLRLGCVKNNNDGTYTCTWMSSDTCD